MYIFAGTLHWPTSPVSFKSDGGSLFLLLLGKKSIIIFHNSRSKAKQETSTPAHPQSEEGQLLQDDSP